MPKIKLCGLFRDCDIDYASEARPDYVGFVFAESRRQIDRETAKRFRQRLSPEIQAVGVFVNEKTDTVVSLANEGVIDLIQLHGNENEETIRQLKERTKAPVIKAVRVRFAGEIMKAETLSADFLLLDTYSPGTMGGTGRTFDWSVIPRIEKPWFLAGGIGLENIEQAKKTAACCLDVSSGIETGGVKDRAKMLEIVRRVRR